MEVVKNTLVPRKPNSADPKSKETRPHLLEITKGEDQVGIN